MHNKIYTAQKDTLFLHIFTACMQRLPLFFHPPVVQISWLRAPSAQRQLLSPVTATHALPRTQHLHKLMNF